MKHVIGPQGMISVAGETQVVVEGGPLFVNGVDVGEALKALQEQVAALQSAKEMKVQVNVATAGEITAEDVEKALEKPAKKTSRKSED